DVEWATTRSGGVGYGVEDGDGHVAAGVAGARRIEGPAAAAFNRLVAHAGYARRGVIFHRHFLSALGRIAAGIGRPPGARQVEGAAAVPGGVGHRVENADGRSAASVTGARRIKGPDAAALDGLAARTGNGRRSVIFQRHFLAALGGVAAGIGRAPSAR